MKDSNLEQRFWSKVNRAGPDDCWLWTAATNEYGYGRIRVGEKKKSSHRVSWQLVHGDIPNSMDVLHSCDTRYVPGDITYRRCCNPAHLWLGTNQDNIDDMVKKGRSAKGERSGSRTHPEKRPRGKANGNAKLTEHQVRKIREQYRAGGISCQALAQNWGVAKTTIVNIVLCRTWRHI